MPNKHSACNPMQKGVRRKKLHDKQNNVGNEKNQPEYENFEGKPIN